MGAPKLVAATARLPPAQLELAAEACRELGIRLLPWAGGAVPRNGAEPVAVIAALEPGERRIPAELRGVIASDPFGPALLLLCNEPLADGAPKVARGRVTLLGPPHSPASIAAELRGLVPGAARPTPRTPAPRRAPVVRSREHLRRRSWAARLQCAEAGAADARFPALHHPSDDGVTLFVPAADRAAPSDAALLEVAAQLAQAGPGPAIAEVAERLGDAVGLIRLSPGADAWQLHWPFEGPLWLVSARRAPTWWDLAAAAPPGRSWLWLDAHEGDLLLGLSRPLPGSAGERAELEAALAAGGPETLELLERRLRARPFAVSGALVTVRGAM
jgi:hypothetical protein